MVAGVVLVGNSAMVTTPQGNDALFALAPQPLPSTLAASPQAHSSLPPPSPPPSPSPSLSPSPPPPPPPLQPPRKPEPGRFMTSEKVVRYFPLTEPTRSIRAAFDESPNRASDWTFSEAGARITRDQVVAWVQHDLLEGPDPFGSDGGVPVPWPGCGAGGRGCTGGTRDDQLGEGEWVGYSRRQLCYLVGRSMIGSATDGYDNGLHRYLERKSDWSTCSARTGR